MPALVILPCSSRRKLLCVSIFVAIYLQLSYVIKIRRIVPKNFNFPETKAVVCSIQTKEDAYIDEWVDYHLSIGFEKIYIYDNSENFDLKNWGEKKLSDNVWVKHFPGVNKQRSAYCDCAKWAENNNETWAAFFDIDEFLLLKKHANVKDFLLEYGPSKGAIGINWIFVGTCNATKYEPKPVTLRFQHTLLDADMHIKTIARVKGIEQCFPHHVYYVDKNTTTIDTNGATVEGRMNKNGTMDIAVLYHYHYKSREEYIAKRERGGSHIDKRTPVGKKIFDEKLRHAKNDQLPVGDTFDDSIWQILKTRVPKYGLLENIGIMQRLSVYLRMFMHYLYPKTWFAF